jgi:hypothetical protein
MKYIMLVILFAVFTAMGAAIGSIWNAAAIGALIGFLAPAVWMAVIGAFYFCGIAVLNEMFKH